MQITNAFKIPAGDSIYIQWLKVLEPKYSLTQKEKELASLFIQSYLFNKKNIINDDILNQTTMSIENKKNIRKKLSLTPTYFQILMKGLKNKKFFINNKINKEFIPSFDNEGNIVLAYIVKNDK